MLSAECTEPRLKLVVLTHPWTKLDTEVRVAPDIASCRWKKGGKSNKTTTTPYCKYAGAGGKQGLEVGRGKIIDGPSWPVVSAKVTLARDQQSLCHWLILSPTQHPYWDTMTVLLLLHKRCHGNHRFLYAASKSDFTKSDEFQKPVDKNFEFVLYDMIYKIK